MESLDIYRAAKALDNMRHADGTPDVQARKDALDKIVDALSHDEIRSLRTRLNAINFNKDIFLNLPVELLLHVSEYLEFEDVMIARDVSRAWRDKFTSTDFATGIVKMHFRTRWEQTDLGDPIAKEQVVNWLPKAALKRLRKRRGQYVSMSAYYYQRAGAFMPINHEIEHQYDSGRIAYKFNESFVVQDLREGHLAQPRAYLEASRSPIRPGEWLLSDAFLVAQGLGRLNLLAWSLTTDDIHQVWLPSTKKYISARGQQVGVITTSSEVLIWDVGGSLASVERPKTQESEGSNWSAEAIIFHPINEKHFFIFYHDSSGNWSGTGLLVQEFRNGAYHNTYTIDIRSELDDPYSKNLYRHLDLRIVRAFDTNGLCVIGWDAVLPPFHQRPQRVKTFNMYTCQFGSIPDPVPTIPDRLEGAARELCQDGRFTLHFSLDDGGIEICANKFCDDDFQILFGDYGYVIWCFGEDIELPVAGSLEGESIEVYPEDRPLPLSGRVRRTT